MPGTDKYVGRRLSISPWSFVEEEAFASLSDIADARNSCLTWRLRAFSSRRMSGWMRRALATMWMFECEDVIGVVVDDDEVERGGEDVTSGGSSLVAK